ncbi:MAG: zinc ribbon domain-containing protein [Actinobacteria bacterium]|nr:zinc ribbon domain-containing protein [Actinomycetota bacterium]
MAVYEYVCLTCEHSFEERRAIGAAVDTALACPSCGVGRVRRRFSVFATGSQGAAAGLDASRSLGRPSGGGCCGGGCACGN